MSRVFKYLLSIKGTLNNYHHVVNDICLHINIMHSLVVHAGMKAANIALKYIYITRVSVVRIFSAMIVTLLD